MNVENVRMGLPIFKPIVLTKEDDDEMRIHANWGCIERLERNILRVSLPVVRLEASATVPVPGLHEKK